MIFDRKDRCYRGGKQHNFHPRYTEQHRPNGMQPKGIPVYILDEVEFIGAFRNYNTLQVYVCDVCAWCGETRKP